VLDKIKSFFRDEDDSKDVAKERLKFVLIQERNNISPKVLSDMKKELISVVSKYIEIEGRELEVNFEEQDDEAIALVANIPVKDRANSSQK
jgi:cell division topological specificity factor